MNRDIATFSAVLEDLNHRDLPRNPINIKMPNIKLGIDPDPYLKSPQELSIHRIRNLDLGDSRSVLATRPLVSYAFEELEALQGSKVFVDWKQYSSYGRATFAKFKEAPAQLTPTAERTLTVTSIQSVEALFSVAPCRHIVLHHDFSEFYVSEFWTGETFVNAALEYYDIPAAELVRVDWKTDSARSCTFVLTFLSQDQLDARYAQLQSTAFQISHYDFVRSTSLEEYQVRLFCPVLSPDNFGFLLVSLNLHGAAASLAAILPSLQRALQAFDAHVVYLFRNASPQLITFALVFENILACQEAYMRLNHVAILDYKATTRFPMMDLLAYPSLPASLGVLPEEHHDDFPSRALTPFSRVATAEPTPIASPAVPLLDLACAICGHAHGRAISPVHSSPISPVSTVSSDPPQAYTTLLTNQIIPWRIQAGLDARTTCMLRNIPNKYTQAMLLDFVNDTHYGLFDFLYLRMDFKNKCNVGYAFINFVDPKCIICFFKRAKGAKWQMFNTSKIADLTYANIQGVDALIRKFRNSSVMDAPLEYRPKLFCTKGDRTGRELAFPLPDKPRKLK